MNKPEDSIIYSKNVLLPEGLHAASISIRNGRINAIHQGQPSTNGLPVKDFGSLFIMPGLIDAHVHINEPGRTEWEGFSTATRAAAAGGVTTLVDMPLNSSPVTTTVLALQEKVVASINQLHVHCGFWAGLVPNNQTEFISLLSNGVLGVKAFLSPSGIPEFPNVGRSDLEWAMPLIAEQGIPLLVHCELESPNPKAYLLKEQPKNYNAYLQSRPKSWENEAIELMIDLCRKYRCRVHIVHLSSAEALPMIEQAKADGLPLTVETCPHYLYFQADSIADGQTQYKCAPPIRERENQRQLWEALRNGLIDFIATDHSPAPPHLKALDSGDFSEAWGGIAGLQFLLPSFWTAAKKQGFGVEEISQLTSTKVATFLGLEKQKGKIAIGYDADLVIWNPDAQFSVTPEMIHHRHQVSPYIGEQLLGRVHQTYLAGKPVYDDGQFSKAQGNTIWRT